MYNFRSHFTFALHQQALIDSISKGNGNIMDSLPEVRKHEVPDTAPLCTNIGYGLHVMASTKLFS